MTAQHHTSQKLQEEIKYIRPFNIVPSYTFGRTDSVSSLPKCNWKDISEVIKNLASVLALIAAGVWTVVQWDTIFPKTSADVQKAAASVRTDVNGSLTVKMGIGENEGSEFVGGPEVPEGQQVGSPAEFCEANPGGTVLKTQPVTGQIAIKSASGIPVSARVENIQIDLKKIAEQRLTTFVKPVDAAVRVVAPSSRSIIDDDGIFFGALRENRIESGQEVKIAFLFDADIPIPCDQRIGALAVFRSSIVLQAINPVSNQRVADQVRKVFISACQIEVRTGAHCNIETLEAYGQ